MQSLRGKIRERFTSWLHRRFPCRFLLFTVAYFLVLSTTKRSVGDLVYWDNQATLHFRQAFDPKQRRVMKRVSLAGSHPF